MRALANFQFIGQLYKHRMGIDKIVHNCVIPLLNEVCRSAHCRGHIRMFHTVDFSSCTLYLGQSCGLIAEQHASATCDAESFPLCIHL
jgi:hypothetical protein